MTPAAVLIACSVLAQLSGADALSLVRGEGEAPGAGRQALRQAQDNAVVGMVIEAVADIAGKRDLTAFKPILDNALQYAGAVRLIAQREEDGSVIAEVEAQILTGRLREDMAMLAVARLAVRPKVLILVAEQHDVDAAPEIAPDGEIERALREALDPRYFEPISPLWRLYSPDELLAKLDGDPEILAELAREHLADAVIAGRTLAAAAPAAPQSNVYRCDVSLTLRVIRASDDALVDTASAQQSVNGPHTAEAVRLAAADAAIAVGPRIRTATAIAVTGLDRAGGVHIAVEGLENPDQLTPISAFIRDIWGVEEVEQVLARPGLGRLIVQYDGPIDLLVEPIIAHPFGPFGVGVRQVVGRDVTLEITEPGAADPLADLLPPQDASPETPPADPEPEPEPESESDPET